MLCFAALRNIKRAARHTKLGKTCVGSERTNRAVVGAASGLTKDKLFSLLLYIALQMLGNLFFVFEGQQMSFGKRSFREIHAEAQAARNAMSEEARAAEDKKNLRFIGKILGGAFLLSFVLTIVTAITTRRSESFTEADGALFRQYEIEQATKRYNRQRAIDDFDRLLADRYR